MAAVLGILILGGWIAAYIAYANWLRKGLRERVVLTRLPSDEIRRRFESSVATMGWKVVDHDNPMVAQSPLLSGRRQQIALAMKKEGDLIRCSVKPVRVWLKRGVPYKSHTLRMRLNAFERAVPSVAGPTTVSSTVTSAVTPAAAAPSPAPTASSAAPTPKPAPSTPAAGAAAGRWADDPFGRHQLRYHDGAAWTEHVSDQGTTGTDPAEWSPSPAVAPAAAAPVPAPLAAPIPTPVAAAALPVTPAALSADDHDGRTMTRADLDALRAERAAVSIELDDGATHRFLEPTLLGRSPAGRPGEPTMACLSIDDPTRSVSKTHLLVRPGAGHLTVEDRGSANGTTVVLPDGTSHDLLAGQPMAVPAGGAVLFGDRRFTVR